MKRVIAVLILLCVLVALVVTNAIYINKEMNKLSRMVAALPDIHDPACGSAARELHEEWESHVRLIDLTVNYPLVDRIGEQTSLIASCVEVGDVYGYASARAILTDALEDLLRAEEFSFRSLF